MDVKLHQRFVINVRRRRQTIGLTQIQVAERLGMRQPSYAAIEAGKCNPGLDVVDRVAEALDCDPGDLLMPVEEKISV